MFKDKKDRKQQRRFFLKTINLEYLLREASSKNISVSKALDILIDLHRNMSKNEN